MKKLFFGMLGACVLLASLLALVIELDRPVESVGVSWEVVNKILAGREASPSLSAPCATDLIPTIMPSYNPTVEILVNPTPDASAFSCTWKSGNELPNQRYCGRISRTYSDEGINYVCCIEDCIRNFSQCTDGTVHDLLGGSCGPRHPEICYPANN